jgi:ectoine hydroxylase-related dioxygenase (phytanoyl-CoA dioxygenase family)
MTILNFRDKSLYPNSYIAEHIYNIETRGYTVIESFLNDNECKILKKGMVSALKDYKPRVISERSFLDKYQMHDLIIRDHNYARLLEDPRINQLIAPCLGQHWIMYAATSSSIPPHGTNYAHRLHVDCPRFQPNYIFNIGVIWALDPYTKDNGALKILPGSQHSETTPSEAYFERNAQELICPKGTLVLFNAKTFHRTRPNNTDEWQHSMTLNACRSFMKQRMDWVRYIPESLANELNPLARRLIGYDTQLPTNLDDFFLPEEQRLYKANQG